MSEGADSVAPTLTDERDATATATYSRRRPRCGTGGPPPSPYMWIDGRQLRSALIWVKKPSEGNDPPRRVSFPTNDSNLVTGYLEPANPWRHAENVSREDLIFSYRESCTRHNTEPLQSVLAQLENLDISYDRCEELNLEGENLNQDHCEPLEEILKRVQFNKINLEGTSLNDESSVILFDMLEYYESARYINVSSNSMIGPRGWQACSHMIKKTQCLEQLEARDITLNEQYMNIMSRALRLVCHLHVLKLENCGLSGRAIVILVTALKMNSGIRELYLADNGLDLYDAIQLGSLLRMNNHLQLLDISNNNVQDDGVRDILEGLINQVNEDKTGKGLSILILWNNRLTKKSSLHISRIIALSKTLETLNIGQNMLTDETLSIINESLKKNRVLLQLGMQSTELTCDGIITLAEIMETNQVLQRIDLRDNSIQMRGMHALVNVLKTNKTITQIDLDEKPRIRIDGPLHQYVDLLAEIRNCCSQNEERRLLEESTEDVESPQHPSRQLNASSRKISLTCQTLPCSSRSAASSLTAAGEPAARTMLEPKRTSGGRLRSPAPSPIPSPVASPIPSPSRNRFVVCRVPEASLRSADSSASSSPITSSSLSSSPTSFFPGANTGSSRFRVSVVESVDAVDRSSSRSVVTSPSGNVTIGFNFKVSVDSDKSDGTAIKMDTATQNIDNTTPSVDTRNSVVPIMIETSSSCEDVGKNEDHCDQGTKAEEAQLYDCNVEMQSGENKNVATTIRATASDKTMHQTDIAIDLESAVTGNENTETIDDRHVVYTSTKELHVPAYPNEDNASRINIVGNNASSSATKFSFDDTATELSVSSVSKAFPSKILKSSDVTDIALRTPSSHATERESTSVQKHKSSLEKLLSLFQYPSNFFSESSSTALQDTKASLQENMNSVMALGDKLQQYLKESRTKIGTDSSLSWSSEHGSPPSKNKSVKLNVSQLQNLSGVFTSFKLDPHANIVDHGTKFFSQTRNQDASVSETNFEKSVEMEDATNDGKKLFDEEKNQIAKNNGRNCVGWEKRQIARDGENNLCDREKSQIVRINETDCTDQEQDQREVNSEEDLGEWEQSQIAIEDEQNLFSRKNQVSRDENSLLDQVKNRIFRIEEEYLEDQGKKQVASNAEENFEVPKENQVVEGGDSQNLGKDAVVGEDAQNTRVNARRDGCSAHELQWTESDWSGRMLPEESVQSKDNFTDKNLVLDDECVANATVSSPASEFSACIAVRTTDIPEYSILELSQAECNNAKRSFERVGNDYEDRRERDDAPRNLKRVGYDNVERDETMVSEDNGAKCSGDDAATTRRTCDTTTTDSINQTSDNNFLICNIARDRQVVDSVSIANASTSVLATNDTSARASAPDNGGRTSSLKDEVSDHSNDKVTSIAHRVASHDFTGVVEEEERDTVEISDHACRDFAHCKSINVNIKLEPCVSETMNPNSGSQDTPSEEFHERRSSVPNSVDVHCLSIVEDAADIDKRIDPTILVTPYEITEKPSKSDTEDLIFCMTDISTDGTSVEDELSPVVASRCSPNDVAKAVDSYLELQTTTAATLSSTTMTTTTLLIENPEGVHRNSQDSGIDENAMTIDDVVAVDAHPLPPARGSLQESVDSGIESECSSICVRMESAAERTLEVLATISKRSSRDSNDVPERNDGGGASNDDDDDDGDDEDDCDDDLREFTTDFLAKEARLVDNDSVSDIARSYLNSIKCAAVSTARPVAGMTNSGASLGVVVTDEGVARSTAAPMIAHSPTAVHGTSPK